MTVTEQTEYFRVEQTPEGIVIFTITRPDQLGAVNPEVVEGLKVTVERLGEEEELRALVIASEGRFFTAGIDITRLPSDRGNSGINIRWIYRKLHLIFDNMEAIEKPIILAAHGPCLGVGVEMASSVDFRFAAESAYFALPEIASIATLPGSGGISRFTRIVGPHWARWIAVANKRATPEQAVAMGFIHEVYPDEVFMEKVMEFTRELVGYSKEAVGLGLLAIDAAWDGDKINARNIDRMANTMLFWSEEYKQSVINFTEASKARAAKRDNEVGK